MRILFIGGTGVISSACSQKAIDDGHELILVNRGVSSSSLRGEFQQITGDINDKAIQAQIRELEYDVVTDWICFNENDATRDLELFSGITKQFIFISSASAYQTPPTKLPITEETPLHNPYWKYSRDKIACEMKFDQAYQSSGFPVTIVRPSHTYGPGFIPLPGRYTLVDRMKQGKRVIIHGDGTSLWTLTWNEDFAVGFNGLFREEAIGETFHITSDEWLNWNQIFETVANAFGTEVNAVHIPSDYVFGIDEEYGAGLLGDKAQSTIFDNSKIRQFVPEFNPQVSIEAGIQRVADWYEKHPESCVPDTKRSELIDRIISSYEHDY